MTRFADCCYRELEYKEFIEKNLASSGKFVGNGERQRAVAVRNRRNLRQVESNDLC